MRGVHSRAASSVACVYVCLHVQNACTRGSMCVVACARVALTLAARRVSRVRERESSQLRSLLAYTRMPPPILAPPPVKLQPVTHHVLSRAHSPTCLCTCTPKTLSPARAASLLISLPPLFPLPFCILQIFLSFCILQIYLIVGPNTRARRTTISDAPALQRLLDGVGTFLTRNPPFRMLRVLVS